MKKRAIILLFIIIVAAFINAWLAIPPSTASFPVDQIIPTSIGTWSGIDIMLPEKVYDILETRAIIHRQYIPEPPAKGEIFLSVVHYDNARIDFHAPEACLGAGTEVLSKSTQLVELKTEKEIRNLDVAVLLPKGDHSENLVYYFYKSGSYAGSSYLLMRLAVAGNRLSSGESGGALIRVSAPVTNANMDDAKTNLIDFLERLYPFLEKL